MFPSQYFPRQYFPEQYWPFDPTLEEIISIEAHADALPPIESIAASGGVESGAESFGVLLSSAESSASIDADVGVFEVSLEVEGALLLELDLDVLDPLEAVAAAAALDVAPEATEAVEGAAAAVPALSPTANTTP